MSAIAACHPVTIVVPIYGDLPSLIACVDSLRDNVDRSIHHVILINDVGLDADRIEERVLAMTAADPGFTYFRNPENLGFVGTCNRAALELDPTDNDILLLNSDTVTTPGFVEELSAVLHESPQHGAVCPRSNNATIASIPFRLRDPSAGRQADRTAAVHAALKEDLPRFSIAPVAMGFCLLIRRELIRKYGLFDEAFAPGYGEENDFCLRIREHGFRSIIANHALVFHAGALSFVGVRRGALRSAHEKLLVSRYPFYTNAVRDYLHQERDPVDAFADALAPGDDVVRALIDLEVPPGQRLDARGRKLLAAANAAADPDTVVFTVSAPDRLAARFGRRFGALRVVRQSQMQGQWDVALAYTQGSPGAQFARLNRTSLRWVLTSALGPVQYADALMDRTTAPVQLVRELVERWGRSPVDVALLRQRWKALTRTPDYVSGATAPREARRIRVLRRAEFLFPRLVGQAKIVARRMTKRPNH